MITKVQYLLPQVQSLLDSAGPGTFAPIDYVLPFLQLTQDQLELECLQNPELGNLETVVIIPNVPAGTVDLTDYFTGEDAALATLIDVITMKERASSGTRQEIDFNNMIKVRDIPTIAPSAFHSYFSVRDNTIVLSGADQAVDLRIFGKFKPAVLKDENSPIVPNTSAILVFGTASLIAVSRGNETMYKIYEKKRLDAQQSFIANAIMELQSVRTRMRSYSGRG